MPLVRIPTPLRSLTKGSAEVQVKGETVADLVETLEGQFPGLRDRLLDESGELRRFINVYVNEEDVRFLQGKGTALKEGDQVSIVPAIAGGRQAVVSELDGDAEALERGIAWLEEQGVQVDPIERDVISP